MNRRHMIAAMAIASLAAGWPVGTRASRLPGQAMRTVGYLSNGADGAKLTRDLAARGYTPGQDLRVVVQMSSRDDRELEARAAALLEARPDVLVAWGARNIAVLARLTRTVPIVSGGTADPVGIGYAKSIRRPGGNITGLSEGVPEMAQTLVELMRAVRPELKRISTFVPAGPAAVEGWTPIVRSMEQAARAQSILWRFKPVALPTDFESGISALEARTSMVFVVSPPQSFDRSAMAAALLRRRLASATNDPLLVRKGGLMHYAVEHADGAARVVAIVDSLLRGAKPAEVPFELPDRATLLVNRATAKAMDITLPPDLLARATEIIG